MILSVLIPSVPSRLRFGGAFVFEKLCDMVEGLNVEVLMLTDNKKRSVGMKRQALLEAAHGDYIAFVDDDDWVAGTYAEDLARATTLQRDLIIFDSFVEINHGPQVYCDHDMRNPNEQYNPAGFKRAPWHIHAWRRELAQAVRFQDRNNGEDWPWCEEVLKSVKTSVKIPKALYYYRYSDSMTEASK